jgi:hypothetical protein
MRSTNAKSRKALARRYDRSGMINACEIWPWYPKPVEGRNCSNGD